MVLKHTQVRDEVPHVTPLHLHRSPNDDGGFSLVEVIVSLGIVTAVVLATAPFFFRAIQREHGEGLRQTAVTVAGQRLDSIRGLSATSLLKGRLQATVLALTSSPGLVDLSQDYITGTGADANYDTTAVATASPVVPTMVTENLNNTTFTVRTYIDPCYRATSTAPCTANPAGGSRLLRVSVDIAWPRSSGETCIGGRPNQCEFVTKSLVDPTATEPVFPRDVSQPTVTLMTPVTPTPTAVHPGQVVTVTMQGTNFVYGGIMTSDDPSDAFTSVTGNNGSAATATLTAGTVGQRLFRFQNPDGGNGGAAPITSFTVTKSSPIITGVTIPALALSGGPVTVTIAGSDFYNTLNAANVTVPPTVAIVETSNGVATTLTPTNVTLNGATSLTTVVTLSPTKGVYTLSATVTNVDTGTATRTSSNGIAL